MAEKMKAGPPITMMPIPPLMHGAAQWGLLIPMFAGGRVVLYGGRSFLADTILGIIEREKVQVISITGDAMARPLIEALNAPGAEYDISSLFVLSSSAAVFSPVVKQQFKDRLPNLIISDAVGGSETGYNGTSLFQGAESEAGRKGLVRIAPSTDTTVIDENGKPLRPGSGAVGMLARGGNIPLGYYKDPEKTAATFIEVEGKRYSVPGDFAVLEADGSITLLGRGSVCINSGGEKIYPEEVEAALKAHPDVFDALVVGVADARWGQRVAAVVQAREGHSPTLEALDRHCRTRIAGYKIPRSLYLADQIERSPSGKPDYPWAKAFAEERAAREA
jgi:acyl-CoA synthetase (AMP-forming)/AMP-acid ligase II